MYVKAESLVAIPKEVVNTMVTFEPELAGVIAVTEVELFTVTPVIAIPLRVTPVVPVKLVPVITVEVPPLVGPVVTDKDVIVGVKITALVAAAMIRSCIGITGYPSQAKVLST